MCFVPRELTQLAGSRQEPKDSSERKCHFCGDSEDEKLTR